MLHHMHKFILLNHIVLHTHCTMLGIVGLSAEVPKVTLINLNYILSTHMTALKAQILLICSTLSS